MPCSQNPLGKENIHCRVKIEIRRIVRQVWFDHACSQEEAFGVTPNKVKVSESF